MASEGLIAAINKGRNNLAEHLVSSTVSGDPSSGPRNSEDLSRRAVDRGPAAGA